VPKQYRHSGLAVELIKAAIEYVKSKGGKVVEGYPVDTQKEEPAPFVFTGPASAFIKVGFEEVARNSPTRPIYRFVIN
jgi:predicted GNAT family acetyltransferase